MLNDILLHAHSGLRWIVLFTLLYALIQSYKGMKSGQDFSKGKKLASFTLMFLHLQALVGIVVFLQSAWFINLQNDAATVMGNSVSRFFAVEHPVMMLLAVILATIGNSKAKKIGNAVKAYKTRFIFWTIALVLILAAIPWPFRFPGSNWF